MSKRCLQYVLKLFPSNKLRFCFLLNVGHLQSIVLPAIVNFTCCSWLLWTSLTVHEFQCHGSNEPNQLYWSLCMSYQISNIVSSSIHSTSLSSTATDASVSPDLREWDSRLGAVTHRFLPPATTRAPFMSLRLEQTDPSAPM